MKKTLEILVVMLVAAVLTAACGSEPEATTETTGGGGGAAPGGGGTRVVASDFSFDPTEIKLQPGEKAELTFVNEDSTTHTFTSDDLGVDVEAEGGTSATVALTAPESGTAEFHCRFHDQMTGAISVGAGDDTKSKDTTEGGRTESGDDGGAY